MSIHIIKTTSYFLRLTAVTFQELQVGDYFRILGISTAYVYRKANSSQCSAECVFTQGSGSNFQQVSLLQPIRPQTEVSKLDLAEVASYLAKRRTELENFFK